MATTDKQKKTSATMIEEGAQAEAQGLYCLALEYYQRAVSLSPNMVEAKLRLAQGFFHLGMIQEAIDLYKSILDDQPSNSEVIRKLFWLSGNHGDLALAENLATQLENMGYDATQEINELIFALAHRCLWNKLDKLFVRLRERIRSHKPYVLNPYSVFASSSDPIDHYNMAKCISLSITKHIRELKKPYAPLSSGELAGRRLRVGFLSGDLCNHAMGTPIAGLAEHLDTSRIQAFAYDYSPEDGSLLRQRLRKSFEHFICLGEADPAQTAAGIAADQLDILIDLTGYQRGSRSEILALRVAHTQVSFLGYVGTQANEWIDFVIADSVVLPEKDERNWSEKIIRLPYCYFPCDRSLPVRDTTNLIGRRYYGLPDKGFVFACFNSAFKISRFAFCAWMKILHATPGSVIWLCTENSDAIKNLISEAKAAGISSDRLIFGSRVPLQEHVNRHTHVDLFLDTWPYGAHSTGVLALWATVPILTILGPSFPSRVAGSLLQALNLPELICATVDDYIATAVSLAQTSTRIKSIRESLKHQVEVSPLFDIKSYAAEMQKAFFAMICTEGYS